MNEEIKTRLENMAAMIREYCGNTSDMEALMDYQHILAEEVAAVGEHITTLARQSFSANL